VFNHYNPILIQTVLSFVAETRTSVLAKVSVPTLVSLLHSLLILCPVRNMENHIGQILKFIGEPGKLNHSM